MNVFANDPANPGIVEYRLGQTADSSKFNVDQNSGLITNKIELDAEEQMTYSVSINPRDLHFSQSEHVKRMHQWSYAITSLKEVKR